SEVKTLCSAPPPPNKRGSGTPGYSSRHEPTDKLSGPCHVHDAIAASATHHLSVFALGRTLDGYFLNLPYPTTVPLQRDSLLERLHDFEPLLFYVAGDVVRIDLC